MPSQQLACAQATHIVPRLSRLSVQVLGTMQFAELPPPVPPPVVPPEPELPPPVPLFGPEPPVPLLPPPLEEHPTVSQETATNPIKGASLFPIKSSNLSAP